MDNAPKILVEFTPQELAWLADRLHEEWGRAVQAKGAVQNNPEKLAIVEKHMEMERALRLRMLDNAVKQGFGDL